MIRNGFAPIKELYEIQHTLQFYNILINVNRLLIYYLSRDMVINVFGLLDTLSVNTNSYE